MKYLNLRWFDYMYYRIYFAYSKTKDPDPWLYATSIVTLVQVLNFLLVPDVIISIFNPNLEGVVTKPCVIISFFIFWVHNYYRYKKKTYKHLCEIWVNESKKTKRRNGFFVMLYVFVMIFTPIAYGFVTHNLAK
ncbi:hypothetical protein [Bacteroides sedimenti]|uniref:Uncharacterized protein n=1 Tax=Bacteroides sedimenti TaxID=2136147 RepID=A0ABN6ZD89_9BACE